MTRFADTLQNKLMNSDFEKKLAEQTLRELPPEWRSEILAAAKTQASAPQQNMFATFRGHLCSLLWPHPRAWAALATVWMAVLFLNFSSDSDAPAVMAKNPTSPDWISALREQQRLLVELTQNAERAAVDRPKATTPSPRSQLRKEQEYMFV